MSATSADPTPKSPENVRDNGDSYEVITEGKASILSTKEYKVFYNPIQQFNRDLSVTAIKAWSKLYENSKVGKRELRKRNAEQMESDDAESQRYITILEALSATGLRALRYGHEIAKVKKIVANDLIQDAVLAIDRNIEYNKLGSIVESNKGDAIHYMSNGSNKFHVIDLDPYGTATPFIDGAIQAIQDEGLLLVTCTDAGVLAGSGYPEKCFALYGGHNFGNSYVSGESNHEAGLRLMLHMISTQAAKYKKTIEPLVSLSIDFYMRVFIRVTTSPMAVKHLASNTMITYHCLGCGNKSNQFMGRCETKSNGSEKFSISSGPPVGMKCHYCTSTHHLAGPMWGGPLHNPEFIDSMLAINAENDPKIYGTIDRIKGMLTVAKNEMETPFYFNLNSVSSLLKTPPIPINDLCNAIGNLGYQMSLTHAQKNCLKTDAPWDVILAINIQWLINCNKQELIKCEKALLDLQNNKSSLDEDKYEKKLNALEKKLNSLKENIAMSVNLNDKQVGYKILTRAQETLPKLEVDFEKNSEASNKIRSLRRLKLVRYQENPTKNWGPKAKPQ